MQVHCSHDELVELKLLNPHPKNRNAHSEAQVARLAEILEYQGWRYPIKVSKLSGFITSGHGRLLAAKLKGWTKVPVNYQEYTDEAQEYADVTADNAIASWAELDLSAVNKDMLALGPDFEIDMLGIKDFTLQPEFTPKAEAGDEDEAQSQAAVECPNCGYVFIKAKA